MILFYLILTTCTASHGCTSSNVHSYLTREDCTVVAHAIERADDTIKATCISRRAEG